MSPSFPDDLQKSKCERLAETKWGSYTTDVERRAILRASELAGPPARALEVGCEGGRWSKMLADLGWAMTCVDVNQAMLALCQSKIPSATCLLANANDRTLPCATAETRLLLCIEVAPVIDSDWFLPEAQRVLDPGGIVVGVFWNRHSFRGVLSRIRWQLKSGEKSIFYKRSYSAWLRKLVTFGFKLVYEEGFCWGPVSRSSDSALVPLWLTIERVCRLGRFARLSPWVVFILRKTPPLAPAD